LAAARRIVEQTTAEAVEQAARRLVNFASKYGIDLSLAWAIAETDPVRPSRKRVRQTCLAVLGSGRTAMLFLSEPAVGGDPGGDDVALRERRAVVDAACEFLATERPEVVRIAQALVKPDQPWAAAVFEAAGFRNVGALTYLRLGPEYQGSSEAPDLGPDAELVTYAALSHRIGTSATEARFGDALEASYEQTLDCPELCGMRSTSDVLDSHRATGQFDPNLWWLILRHQKPVGCLLLNPNAEQEAIELVYLGLGLEARGKQWGRKVLSHGICVARRHRPTFEVACAVDDRNVPARKLYDSLGFREAGHRVGWVKAL
jgi:ribosomal protein S18 acetylase RimI-like enzyme